MSISYELALKLKDAGFPQRKMPLRFPDGTKFAEFPIMPNTKEEEDAKNEGYVDIYDMDFREKYGAYVPTLGELIEACGDKFTALVKKRKYYWAFEDFDPSYLEDEELMGYAAGKGSTPEEAVANLWLALNKK